MVLTFRRLSLEDARMLIAGAEERAREIGLAVCVSVVDESGHTIAFERMDGAKSLSVRLSDDKAFTAALSRRPTHEYNELCQPGSLLFGIHTSSGGRFSLVGGGYPIVLEDEILGAIGVSGGSPDEDMDCASTAIRLWSEGS